MDDLSNTYRGIPIRPLFERLPDATARATAPAGIDSSTQINVSSDLEAIDVYLEELDHPPGTERVYRREIERLVLWTWAMRQKSVLALNRSDLELYADFLENPQPTSVWCGPKTRRESMNWRPFEGRLGEKAINVSLAAVKSLLEWFTNANYIDASPLAGLRQKRKKEAAGHTRPAKAFIDKRNTRAFDEDMWLAVTAAVEAMPRSSLVEQQDYERMRYLCSFLYLLAPRTSEIASLRMNSFQCEDGLWWWHVPNNDKTEAKIPVPDDMMTALIRYRLHLGLPEFPTSTDDTPLFSSVKNGFVDTDRHVAVTDRRIHQVFKALCIRAGDFLPPNTKHKAAVMATASPGWGRQTAIFAAARAGVPMRFVQQIARHQQASTTAPYRETDDATIHAEARGRCMPWSDLSQRRRSSKTPV